MIYHPAPAGTGLVETEKRPVPQSLRSTWTSRDGRTTEQSVSNKADFKLRRGHWFCPDLTHGSPNFHAMIETIENGLQHQESRLRRRKATDASNHTRHLAMVVANALSVAWHRNSPWVAYQRANDAYTNKSIWPEWLSTRMLVQVVDALAKSDFVECQMGGWGERSSTFKATEYLQALARQLGVHRWGLSLALSRKMLVRLKDTDKRLLSCVGCDDVDSWTDFLEGYNRFLAGHDIEFAPEDDGAFSVRFKKKQGMGWEGLKEPELFRSSLYRVFNDGSFRAYPLDTHTHNM